MNQDVARSGKSSAGFAVAEGAAVVPRCDAAPERELLAENGGAVVPDSLRDLLDAQVGGLEQFLGVVQPLVGSDPAWSAQMANSNSVRPGRGPKMALAIPRPSVTARDGAYAATRRKAAMSVVWHETRDQWHLSH